MAVEARLVRVRGLVQGVAFRHFTKVRARELNLTGWVRNVPDGSVLVWAEGPPDALETLIAWLHRGPPAARVESVEVSLEDHEGYPRFEVAREV